jgi:hypothetical protein
MPEQQHPFLHGALGTGSRAESYFNNIAVAALAVALDTSTDCACGLGCNCDTNVHSGFSVGRRLSEDQFAREVEQRRLFSSCTGEQSAHGKFGVEE